MQIVSHVDSRDKHRVRGCGVLRGGRGGCGASPRRLRASGVGPHDLMHVGLASQRLPQGSVDGHAGCCVLPGSPGGPGGGILGDPGGPGGPVQQPPPSSSGHSSLVLRVGLGRQPRAESSGSL